MTRPAADLDSTTTEQTESVTRSTSKPTSKTECALAVSQSVFTILKNISQMSTVPCLQEAAAVACALLQMVQDMKSNKEAYESIIQEVCTLLVCISIQPGKMSDGLQADLENLVKDLEDIQKLCHRLVARNRMVRFFLSQKDAGDINQIRLRIESTFRIFYLKSTINIRAIQESWSGKDNPQLTQDLLDELKAQRDFMEKTGNTIAALQIPANQLLDNQTTPARAMQEFHGGHVFEDEVRTRNDYRDGSNITLSAPMQSFTGQMTFKGKVRTVNRII